MLDNKEAYSMGHITFDKMVLTRRLFLLATAATVGSYALTACGSGGGGTGNSPNCDTIGQNITHDNNQIQALQQQRAGTTNQATIGQINTQIAGLQQDISSLQQQAKQTQCP